MSTWECPKCTFLNDDKGIKKCLMCGLVVSLPGIRRRRDLPAPCNPQPGENKNDHASNKRNASVNLPPHENELLPRVSTSPTIQPPTLSSPNKSTPPSTITTPNQTSSISTTANDTSPIAKTYHLPSAPEPVRPDNFDILELLAGNHPGRADLFKANLGTETSGATMGVTSSGADVYCTLKMVSRSAYEDSVEKHTRKTIGALREKEKCYITNEEKGAVTEIANLCATACNYLHEHKQEIFTQDEKGEWGIGAKRLDDDLVYESTGDYYIPLLNKVGCAILSTKGMGKRGLEQLVDEDGAHQEELENASGNENTVRAVVREHVFALRTTQDNLSFAKSHPDFCKIVANIMMKSFSHHSHSDHIVQNFHETVDFVFEMFLGCSLEGCSSIMVMERYFCLGSKSVRKYIRMPSKDDDTNKDAIELHVGTENATFIQTWQPYMSRLRQYISTMELDPRTREAVNSMIRTFMQDGYLQWHYTCRLWGYFDNVSYTGPFDSLDDPIFPTVKRVAVEIVQVVQNQNLSAEQKKGRIDEALQSICSDWNHNTHDVGYIEPDQKVLCAAAAKMIPQVVEDAKTSSFQKEVIVVEHHLIYGEEFDEDTRDFILDGDMLVIRTVTGARAGELWRTSHGKGKTILIFVIYSNHVLYGWKKTMAQRLHHGSCAITYMSIMEAAGLIPPGTTEREYKIMLSFFIGAEGLFGDVAEDDLEDGNFFFCVKKALPWTYFKNAYRPGTHALAHRVFSDLHPLHIVSLMAVMGFRSFSTFFHLLTGITVPVDSSFAEFLLEVRTNLHNERRRESNQRRNALFIELREIARTPAQNRTEMQMARADDILMTYGSNTTYLLDDICKCDRSITEDGTETNALQRLQRIVSNRRVREYMAYLGVYYPDIGDAIVENSMLSRYNPSAAFQENDLSNNFFT